MADKQRTKPNIWMLTGRSRPRIGLLGRLIVQVEEERDEDRRWRDARAQDLLPISTAKEGRAFG